MEVEKAKQSDMKSFHVLMGPIIFLIIQTIPIFGPASARIGFGILFWMVYWWITVAVDIKITVFVPLIVVAFYPYLKVGQVMQMYVHKFAFLILGATAVTTAWTRWGFAKRLALRFLLIFGNQVQKQVIAWFMLTAVTSFVMGNTPVGAVFAPIAVAFLTFAGYETHEKRWDSKAASNMLIAVAWGASIGGMTTPLGGGQAVVTLGFFEKYLGQEIFFSSWTARMLPLSILITAVMTLYIYFAMRPEINVFPGSKDYYRSELEKMGPMSYEEKLVCYGFFIILILAITRPLYVGALKGPYFKWLHPSPLFFILAMALLFIPSKSVKGETILSIPTLAKYYPVSVVFIWPGAVALGRVLVKTGVTKVLGQWLTPFIGLGDVWAIAAFSFAATTFSEFSTDTSAAGVMVPVTIEAFKNWHGLQFGSVAFIWIVGASLSWSYSVASATGAHGIVAGFGVNLKRMFIYGMIASLISWIVTTIYFLVTVLILKMDFYILPPG